MSEAEGNPNMEQKCPTCGAPLPSGVLAGLCPACLLKQGAANDTGMQPEAAPFQPPSIEEVARMFPQLEILAFIGKGGMGAVYKARQPGLDRIVALKILPPHTAADQGFIERFNREARALARLTHPNIVTVHEFGQVNGLPYFIMEFVDGLNLRQLEQAGRLAPREALQIVPQICEALQYAHDEGIVHRDIKPENILVDKRGRVKIADFGIAKILGVGQDKGLTGSQGAIGTPHYMAPEQMEKPTTVDHRADIFSLGVVFYEMLTGELPLGKFAPPSSRRVEVDVRLDDVVLRALEKDPERRYQQIRQVKTAVDTIGSTAGTAPASTAQALAQEILTRDYTLHIRSCLRRGWALVKGNFWRLVGITALIMVLLAVADSAGQVFARRSPPDEITFVSSIFFIILFGPLLGGLSLYFLKTVRGEPRTVETAFSGFGNRFLHLFLAGFVGWILTILGFLCFVLPGIYLLVAWMFTLLLVVDKQLDFWSAMELSRKVVTRHWWKVFGLLLMMLLTYMLGVLLCGVGVFITATITMAAATFAYEDIFGAAGQAATNPAPPKLGPSGTVVSPPPGGTPPAPPVFGGGDWKRPPAVIGLAALVVALIASIIFIAAKLHQDRMREAELAQEANERQQQEAHSKANQPEPPLAAAALTFGPVIERDLQARATGTNQFLDLDSEKLLTPPAEISDAMALATNQPAADEVRLWEGLDIPQGSRRAQYLAWLRESGSDLMYAGDGKIIGFDGIFPMAHGNSAGTWDDWNGLTPDQVRAAVEVVEWRRLAAEAQLHGQPAPAPPASGGIYNSAAVLDSREQGGPNVNLLTRDQSVTWFFKTREGRMGVLQLVGFTDNPQVAKIRFKLLQNPNEDTGSTNGAVKFTKETLSDRLEAAKNIMNMTTKDKALAVIAVDAAKSGEVGIVKDSLGEMNEINLQSKAARDSVRALGKRGLRKAAMEIANNISDITLRDQALTELAQ